MNFCEAERMPNGRMGCRRCDASWDINDNPASCKPWPKQANDVQIGGEHYMRRAIQPWDYIAANGLGFFEGNIIKYVTRWRSKDGLKDLEKARHYLDKLIEVESVCRTGKCDGDHAMPPCSDPHCWNQ